MNDKTTLVLLHGAGTGAWVWERVLSELATPAIALEVPSRTDDATPDRCAANLVAELDRRGIHSVVLVLHSLAGVLAPEFAHRLGTRLKRCVYVSAIVPPTGGSFADALGLMNRLILRMLFKFNPHGLKPSADMIRRELCNDLDPQDADRVVSFYTAERPGLYLTPVGQLPTDLSTTYIKLLKDQTLSPKLQDSMISRLSKPSVQTIDAGHLVMLSNPASLAKILDETHAQHRPSTTL